MKIPCIIKHKIPEMDPTFLKLQAKRILSVPRAPEFMIPTVPDLKIKFYKFLL